MKGFAIKVGGGPNGEEREFRIAQDENMYVTAFRINSTTGDIDPDLIYLGTFGDINHLEVNGQITELLSQVRS
ncbi:hypothetical protein [Spirosoma luteum]|uniref:hypothetical protein n=1 Tax=Spirosoma luteum TaxID=431553 RepID=UPI0003689AF0|nr:hypothetical protein [Spirosoma luteum]